MAATGVSIYDEGVQRPLTITGWYGPSALAFGDNAEQLYGIDAGTSGDVFFRMAVSASGVTIVDRISGLIGGNARRIYYVNGRVYASTGVVLDPVHRVRLGCFPLPPSSFYFRDVAVDAIQGVAFGLADRVSGLAGNKTPVSAYGIDTYRYQWTAAVSDDSAPGSWSNRLVRWPGGIALRADYSKALFIVDFASSHRLTLSTSGTGRGTAVAAALSMACGADCARLVPEGTSVTLSATEQAGSSFVRWDGDADCADGVVTMAGGRSCVAVFRARTTGLGTRIGLAARDLAYSNATGKIYASIPGTNPIRGNTITEIDPTTGDLGASLWVGSEPDVLRLSEDGLTLYVGLDGAGAIRRVSVATMSALEEFSIGAGWAGYWPSEFQVLPGGSGLARRGQECPRQCGGRRRRDLHERRHAARHDVGRLPVVCREVTRVFGLARPALRIRQRDDRLRDLPHGRRPGRSDDRRRHAPPGRGLSCPDSLQWRAHPCRRGRGHRPRTAAPCSRPATDRDCWSRIRSRTKSMRWPRCRMARWRSAATILRHSTCWPQRRSPDP